MAWLDFTAALIAFASAATLRTPEMIGLALSTFLAIILIVLFIFGRVIRQPPFLIWTHLAVACGFLAVTTSAALER